MPRHLFLRFFLVFLMFAGAEMLYAGEASIKTVYTLIDEQNHQTIEGVQQSDWQQMSGDNLNFGFLNGTVWLKVTFSGRTDQRILELKNANLDIIEFYKPDGKRFYSVLKTGDHFTHSEREGEHRFYHLHLDGAQEVLIRVRNYGDQLFIPMYLHTEESLYQRDYNEQFVFGIYYGLCFFAFFLNFFLFIKVREQSNLYYACYLIGLILLQLALDGHGFQYFWGENIYFANHAPPLMASVSVFALILFTQQFLRTKVLLPRVNKLFSVFAILVGLNSILSLIPVTYQLSILAINVLTLLLNLLIIPVALYAWRKNFKPARFFLTAFILLIFSVFAFVLRNFGVLPSTFVTDYSLQIGSAFEVVLLSFAIVDKFKSFKDESLKRLQEINYLQSKQNEMLEDEVRTRTARISEQKNQLEQTNREIIDSINYAKRIQTSLIPSREEFARHLPDSFVYWEPKDIVSGDFYWVSEVTTTFQDQDNSTLTVFCVGDCTGHGVPGAILSVLGLKILNLSLKDTQVNSTAQALDFLHEQFNKTFHTAEDGSEGRDGMDIAFCALDRANSKLYFSGAKHNLLMVRGGELIEVKGDRMSIGAPDNGSKFTQHVIDVHPDDMIYLVSDGLADQFGGPKGKKFKFAAVKELFISMSFLPVSDQEKLVNEAFIRWKGTTEQTDDVCVVGVRVS